MNMFMNLFKFNLFKFCSNYVLKFEHVHEQFLLFMNMIQKKKMLEKFQNVHEPFMNTGTRDFLHLVHEQKFDLNPLQIPPV
jgi:hypothetical protein